MVSSCFELFQTMCDLPMSYLLVIIKQLIRYSSHKSITNWWQMRKNIAIKPWPKASVPYPGIHPNERTRSEIDAKCGVAEAQLGRRPSVAIKPKLIEIVKSFLSAVASNSYTPIPSHTRTGSRGPYLTKAGTHSALAFWDGSYY